MQAEHEALLCEATGRKDVPDALAWLAEGRRYRTADVSSLMHAIVEARRHGHGNGTVNVDAALREVSRTALRSDVDTSAALADTVLQVTPEEADTILANLLRFSARGTLSSVEPGALRAAIEEDPRTVDVFAQVAGLTYKELKAKSAASGVRLPAKTSSAWTTVQLRAVIAEVTAVLARGHDSVGPVEVLTAPAEVSGWEIADGAAHTGVSYGTLLAQRIVGGAWSTQKNRTAILVREALIHRIADEFAATGINFWSVAGPADTVVNSSFLATQVSAPDARVGQLALVAYSISQHGDRTPMFAVLVAVAQDGGSARKTAATLLAAPSQVTVPVAVVLAGQGWANRSESDQLVNAYNGRVYTDRRIHELVERVRKEQER